jgi:uncharacterized protein YxeA
MDTLTIVRLILSIVLVFCCGFYFYIRKREEADRAKEEALLKEQRASVKYETLNDESEQAELYEMGLDNYTIKYLMTKSKAEGKTPAEIIGEMVRERQSVTV